MDWKLPFETISGDLRAEGRRFAIVASRFNERVVRDLISGAVECLAQHGASLENIVVVRVPGAFEIPQALRRLAATREYDAYIALGVVIRGETPHFDYVCGEAASGISAFSNDHKVPVGFGLLTCDTTEQAEARAGGKAGNKGWDAALAAIEMADLWQRLGSPDGP